MKWQLPLIILTWLCAVSSTQAATCMLSVGDMTFGIYLPGQPNPVDASSSITVQCEADIDGEDVNYSLSIGPSDGAFAPRTMHSEDATLSYNVFVDAARSTVWGDGSVGTGMVSGQLALPAVSSVTSLVHGRVFGGQSLRSGSYTDLLTVTVEY